MALSPEDIGLCGCWQVIAVQRQSQDLTQLAEPPSLEIGYYVTSLAWDERNDAKLMAIIRAHWAAIENGTHYRRDLTVA